VQLLSGELIVPDDAPEDLIRAAGGVVYRTSSEVGVEVACIYRERRGDWTFPKGKLEEGESFVEAALREVAEETGLRCEIERYIGVTNYTHRKGQPKIVAYYLMTSIEGEFSPNEEVDELRWLPIDQVHDHLTWDRDQELFELIRELPELQKAS
jgi:8-oxo-dGTP diphosphatase